MPKMTKHQIASHLAAKAGVSKAVAGVVMDELVGLAYRELGRSFTISDLGTLVLVTRKTRRYRHPVTGKIGIIHGRVVVKMRLAKRFRRPPRRRED
jgi:DNA-binding protein HU-beta